MVYYHAHIHKALNIKQKLVKPTDVTRSYECMGYRDNSGTPLRALRFEDPSRSFHRPVTSCYVGLIRSSNPRSID